MSSTVETVHDDGTLRLIHGDALAAARTLPDQSVQTIVTSPPYFGLRNYDEDGQYGAEDSVEAYVEHLVVLFRELRRVLRDEGTLWVNLGDSYSGRGGAAQAHVGELPGGEVKRSRLGRAPGGIAPKNLLGIPWRVAFALQADGWILRSEIIWQKPNAMPESATDRPSREHEHIFLLAKSASYFYDGDAIREQYAGDRAVSRRARSGSVNKENSIARAYQPDDDRGRSKRDVWSVPTVPFKAAHFAVYPPELIRPCILAGSRPGDMVLDPFSGSGTTGQVAITEGRRYLGIELNRDFLDLSIRARFADMPVPLQWEAA